MEHQADEMHAGSSTAHEHRRPRRHRYGRSHHHRRDRDDSAVSAHSRSRGSATGAPLGGGAGEALVSKVCNKSDSSRGIEFDRNSQTKGFHVVSRFFTVLSPKKPIFTGASNASSCRCLSLASLPSSQRSSRYQARGERSARHHRVRHSLPGSTAQMQQRSGSRSQVHSQKQSLHNVRAMGQQRLGRRQTQQSLTTWAPCGSSGWGSSGRSCRVFTTWAP